MGIRRRVPVGQWLLLLAVLVACVALGYGAYYLAGVSWNAVVEYRSPYTGLTVSSVPAVSEPASRTVLVIVDGLRLDASREMKTLNALREHGTDVELIAPQPSLSYPNWTTLLSGAPPYVSGVVTNWHEGPAPVESLFDAARSADATAVFVGPEDFEQLYGVTEKTAASFMRRWDKAYLSAEYVDAAIRLAKEHEPRLLVVHLPDIDEAGHAHGGASPAYAEAVEKVDMDLNRLVQALQDGETVFAVVSDHGHIDSGGHGGWESEVVAVPGVFAGPRAVLGTGTGRLEQVAPTVAVLAGLPVPRFASDFPLDPVVGEQGQARSGQALLSYAGYLGAQVQAASSTEEAKDAFSEAARERERSDRMARLPYGLLGMALALLVIALVGVVSWRALVAALSGAAAYYLVYNALFFVAHGYRWSLSAFNSEDLIEAWMNGRLIEAALSGLVAVAVAAAVYPLLRKNPKGPSGPYLPGWLTLGPVTILVTLATLGMQVAWFVWAWGIVPQWRLPDLKWGFKYDLDLIQMTALGFVAVLTPVVTYLIGRYHPKVTTSTAEE